MTLKALHHLKPRNVDLGGFIVRRLLPKAEIRKVGPWVFFDHFGPANPILKKEMDVRPHPHCGLSTVTYLFEGAIEHRDSAGGHAIVRPEEIHWMRAGHGIVHSERAPKELLGTAQRRHGLQLWCAHPDGEEEQAPRFDSYFDLPRFQIGRGEVHLLAGNGWGERSPVDVTSPLVYASVRLKKGDSLPLPDHQERAVYVLEGRLEVGGVNQAPHELVVLEPGRGQIRATEDAHLVILGGEPIGPRFIWWNLVHSNKERLREQAERWRNNEFPTIPGDNSELIPAPAKGP